MEGELHRRLINPREATIRQICSAAWPLIVGDAPYFAVELLLAEAATDVLDHESALERIQALIDSKRYPKDEFPNLRRARYFASLRIAGEPVPGE